MRWIAVIGACVGLVLATPHRSSAAAIGFLEEWGCPLTLSSSRPADDLQGPWSVAVRQSGEPVFVAENGNPTKNRILELTASGKVVTTWTSGAMGPFVDPQLGLSAEGVYVGGGHYAPSVQSFGVAGASVTPGPAWGPTDGAYFEQGVRALVGSQTSSGTPFVIVVEQPDLTANTNVFLFNKDGLSLARLTGDAVDAPSLSFGTVAGVSVAGGYVWVADRGTSAGSEDKPWRLLRYTLGIAPSGGLGFTNAKVFDLPAPPRAIWGTASGVWVAMQDELSTFAKFGYNGSELMRFNENDVPGNLAAGVRSIAADQFDNVYLVDGGQVVKFGPGGTRGAGGLGTKRIEKCLGGSGETPGGTTGETPSGPTGEGDLGLRISTSTRSVLRLGGPVFTVRCDTPCIASASGKASIAGGRSYKMTRVSGKRYATVTTLHPRLGPRALGAIRAAMARGTRVLLTMKLGAIDRDGVTDSQVVLKRAR